jgi:hypothetical protein
MRDTVDEYGTQTTYIRLSIYSPLLREEERASSNSMYTHYRALIG